MYITRRRRTVDHSGAVAGAAGLAALVGAEEAEEDWTTAAYIVVAVGGANRRRGTSTVTLSGTGAEGSTGAGEAGAVSSDATADDISRATILALPGLRWGASLHPWGFNSCQQNQDVSDSSLC